MTELDRLGWAVSRSYEVAGIGFGLRTNSEPFVAWLDDAFGAYRIAEELPPYFSVLVADDEKPGKRFHLIYEQARVLVRSHSLATIGRALIAQFELLQLPTRDDALFAEMTLLPSNGHRALVPPLLLSLLKSLSYRVIQRAGVILPYSTTVAIDPDSGELVPMPAILDVPDDAIERLPVDRHGDSEPRVGIDRPLHPQAVLSFGYTPELEPVSKAVALYRAASHTLNIDRIGPEIGLEALRRTVESARCFELAGGGSARLLEKLSGIWRP